jgi:dipeptidyl aminopeptidase/acylaminoacyl peptidase
MRTRAFLYVASFVLALATGPTENAQRAKPEGRREYVAPDGSARVVVVPVGKQAGRADYESRIEFRTDDGEIACSLEYSSRDSEHGFGVVKAEWTPDSQYFVFSLTSSGGHQAWHAPTQFLSRKDRKLRTLDDYFVGGITKANFSLVAPNTVRTEGRNADGEIVPASVKLTALPPLRSWRKSKPFVLDCVSGHVFTPEQP